METETVVQKKFTLKEKAIADFFEDDPFCDMPDFPIEDANHCICSESIESAEERLLSCEIRI
jgi:hypothetical protein